MKYPVRLALLLVSLLPPLYGGALELTGYYKSFFSLFLPPADGLNGTETGAQGIGMLSSRLRLNLSVPLTGNFRFQASYDLIPRLVPESTKPALNIFESSGAPVYRFDDIPTRIYPRKGQPWGNFFLNQNLDRFCLTVSTSLVDITVGRQPVSWGSARFVNPTDIIAPFQFHHLDTEDRPGVDAIRFRFPLGAMAELDAGVIAGDNLRMRTSALYARGKVYWLDTDISVLLMRFHNHLLIGFDLSRSLGGAGFWLEGAYVRHQVFEILEGSSEPAPYLRLSVGLDYQLTKKWYLYGEYHFNSIGESSPGRYASVLSSESLQEGGIYLAGMHYLTAGWNYQLHPLLPFSGMIIINGSDGSIMLAPQLEYNIRENVYLGLGAYLGLGQAPAPGASCGSEFGAYPDILYGSFRIYF